MNFEFSEDQRMLRDEARKFLTEQCPPEEVRRTLDSDATHSEKVWNAVVEMGWTATALPEEYGGFGMGYLELCVIAEEIGRAAAPIPFSSAVYLAAECILAGGTDAQKNDLLPKLASGEAIGTLALAEQAGPVDAKAIACSVKDGKLNGCKVVVPDAEVANYAIVAAKDGQGVSLYIASLSNAGVTKTRQRTVDPSRSHYEVVFKNVPVDLLGKPGKGLDVIDRVFDRAAVLMAFEQLGGANAALDMACKQANERFAFGRAIGSFQAIKHRIAEMYVSMELARSNCYYGAWALSTNASELPIAAAAARVAAGQAFYECARENIQVHGGMGFTWESDCHFYYRRSKLLSLALGSERAWKDKLIERLAARKSAPSSNLDAA